MRNFNAALLLTTAAVAASPNSAPADISAADQTSASTHIKACSKLPVYPQPDSTGVLRDVMWDYGYGFQEPARSYFNAWAIGPPGNKHVDLRQNLKQMELLGRGIDNNRDGVYDERQLCTGTASITSRFKIKVSDGFNNDSPLHVQVVPNTFTSITFNNENLLQDLPAVEATSSTQFSVKRLCRIARRMKNPDSTPIKIGLEKTTVYTEPGYKPVKRQNISYFTGQSC